MRLLGGILLVIAVSLPVLADEESDREADMFGEENDAKRDDEVFGAGDPDPGKTMAEKLEKTDDPLTIGGKLYMRFNYNILDEGDLEDFRFQSPNLMHLYLDSRPTDRLRAFARGRLTYDFTISEGDTDMFGQELESLDAFLDQLWLKFDIEKVAYVTIGRQPVRWGSGRFWNPTDFLNQQARDPLAIFDERLGTSLIKVHIPVESLGWNFYAVANLQGADTLDRVGGAVRAEMLFGDRTEVSVSAALRKDDPVRLGLDLSTGIWDFDIRLEGAVIHGEQRPFWEGTLDLNTLTFPTEVSREDDWIPQLTAGAEISILYSEQDSLIVGLEYFYNDAGYENAKLYPWLALNGGFVPFYLGKQYISGYLVLMNPGDWNDTTFMLSGIANWSDGTGVVRIDYRVTLLTYLELSVFASAYTGDEGEFHLAVEVPPIDGIEGLEDGFRIPGNRAQIGVWLALRI